MLCGCVGEKTTKNCLKQIKKARQDGADLIELRLDLLENKDDLEQMISASLLPIIATNRNGDQKLLLRAIEAGAKYIDMDIKEVNREVLKLARRKKCRIILSYHNFKKTPSVKELLNIAQRLRKDADIIKIVTSAKSLEDNQAVLSLYQKTDYPLLAFAMGKIGQPTRISCLAHRALWTYCSIGKNAIASGQISLEQASKTKLIREAESVGCKTVLGYKMLAYQGAQSFRIWTGLEPDTKAMLSAVKKQLLSDC